MARHPPHRRQAQAAQLAISVPQLFSQQNSGLCCLDSRHQPPLGRRTSVAGERPVEGAVGGQQAAGVRVDWVGCDIVHWLGHHARRGWWAGGQLGRRGAWGRGGRAVGRRRQRRHLGSGRHRRRRQQQQGLVPKQPLFQVSQLGVVALELACGWGGRARAQRRTGACWPPSLPWRTCRASQKGRSSY